MRYIVSSKQRNTFPLSFQLELCSDRKFSKRQSCWRYRCNETIRIFVNISNTLRRWNEKIKRTMTREHCLASKASRLIQKVALATQTFTEAKKISLRFLGVVHFVQIVDFGARLASCFHRESNRVTHPLFRARRTSEFVTDFRLNQNHEQDIYEIVVTRNVEMPVRCTV